MSALALFACASDSNTVRFIDEILQRRATHLADGDRRDVAVALIRTERRTGVDTLLLLALMEEESHYKYRARSRRGALGLLQVRPATGREVAERNRIPWDGEDSLFEPTVNILIGGTYLSELKNRFGSWDLALTAYHQGPTKAKKAANRGRTPSSRYAARVLRRFEAFKVQSE
jgi:soluble lytic murein transglycosylase